jgi:hypothetical protein
LTRSAAMLAGFNRGRDIRQREWLLALLAFQVEPAVDDLTAKDVDFGVSERVAAENEAGDAFGFFTENADGQNVFDDVALRLGHGKIIAARLLKCKRL